MTRATRQKTPSISATKRKSSILPPISGQITYIIPVEDGSPYEATLLQGFAPSLTQNSWIIRAVTSMPSNVWELTPEWHDTRLPLRISGQSPLRWFGQSPKALMTHKVPEFSPFTIIFFGQTHNIEHYRHWIDSHSFPIVTVAEAKARISYSELSMKSLQSAFLDICDAISGKIEQSKLEDVREAISQWIEPESKDLGYKVGGHNSVFPNLAALQVAGYIDTVDGPFADFGNGIAPYVSQIAKTARSVIDLRKGIGLREGNRDFPPTPELNIFAPSIYPHVKELSLSGVPLEQKEKKQFVLARNALERQTGYSFEFRTNDQKAIVLSGQVNDDQPNPHFLMRMRAAELRLGTDCVGALAASEISATLRLPNSINRTAGQVKHLGLQQHTARVTDYRAAKMFSRVQKALSECIPKEFYEFLEQNEHGIRIISDAHLEWVELRGLPLAIQKNVTRIPTTPGNLFIQSLNTPNYINLSRSDFSEVLLISAMKRDDPLLGFVPMAIDAFKKVLSGKVRISVARVAAEADLIAALNSFQGAMVIFDGHGSHEHGRPGVLHLQDEAIDVWSLQSKMVRIPPIVVLSACDTHAADRNHASAANGFLALGARAVLGSVFPLNGLDAAAFLARLLHRTTNFIGPAQKMFGRSLTWLEIMSGMIRMQLLTDFLRRLQSLGLIDEAVYFDVHEKGNFAINSLQVWPFEAIIELLREHGVEIERASRELRTSAALSSATKYIQLGRPETLLIHPD